MKKLLIILVTLISFLGFAQTKNAPQPEDFDSVMSLTAFWEKVFKDDTIAVNIQNVYVITKDKDEEYKVRTGILSQNKIVRKSINVSNVYFKGYYLDFFKDFFSSGFNIDSTTFLKPIEIKLAGIQGLFVHNCKFEKFARLEVDGKAWLGINIEDSKFNSGYFFGVGNKQSDENNTSLIIKNSVLKKANWEWFNRFDNIIIEGSKFLDSTVNLAKSTGVFIQNGEPEIVNMEIKNSVFESPIRMSDTKIKNHFQISNTKLSFIAINTVKFPEDIYEFRCKWDVLDSSLAYLKEYQSAENKYGGFQVTYAYFNLYSDSSIIIDEIHDVLKSKAYQILGIYKAQGDLKSYNACYKDIKNFENKRLRYEYKINPTFEGWFHWRLNELISTYSDYGTNPAKAVIKSFWVILLFTFFYMFFPSEWDISSKSTIISNFKRVRDKNDKTASPILKAFAYIVVSFLNAFTLSLNAFVTLGFGQIPTKGVARYITILQGFIGWFLLTIFSVSLISQVLN